MNDRIKELEQKSAFQENLLTQLNEVLVDQQKKLMSLERQVNSMKEQFVSRDLVKRQEEETPPPHY